MQGFAEQPVWTGDIRGPGTAGTGQQPEQYPADPSAGADYTRKEYISGGDLEITINGKITSKYPDVYPEAEVSKFIRLVQYKGVIDCDNTVLRQFNISRLIIQGYTLQPTDCRNVQPYSLNCVAVEPSEAVELKLNGTGKGRYGHQAHEQVDQYVKFGTEVIDPASLLKLTRLWV